MLGKHFAPYWILFLSLTAHGTASVQSSASVAVPGAPVTWLIFADDLHLDFRNTGRIRDLLRTIAAELMGKGYRVAITSSGPSGLTIDITADHRMLDGAIKRTTGNALNMRTSRWAVE
jgi:hypothetical protein